jgi:serine/threonine protein kinase
VDDGPPISLAFPVPFSEWVISAVIYRSTLAKRPSPIAAHERGIVHRDLKPANIKLTPAGVVKILDFGLAKSGRRSRGGAAPASSATMSPTLSLAMTQAGMVLGTAAYMSPEQARGKPVDKRADVWAFGVVLYEMLTGKRLFEGEDLTETLASVVKDRPDLSGVPAEVRRLLERCLEKDPKKRLRDIGDLELLLARHAPLRLHRKRHRLREDWPGLRRRCWRVAAGIALWAPWRSEKPVDRPLVRLEVDLGADVWLPAPGAGRGAVWLSRPMERGWHTSRARQLNCSPGASINRKPPSFRERRMRRLRSSRPTVSGWDSGPVAS